MTISVIVPCFNVQDYVADAVASVAEQTYQDLEIICIDNNSSDNTWAVLQELKRHYPHILTIDKEATAGANAVRNKGLSHAKGQWAQFLDADDLLLQSKIEHQVQLIRSCAIKDLAFIVAASKRVNISGNEVLQGRLSEEVYLAPFINQAGITSANLWSIAWLKKVGMWNEAIKSSQETDLMLRLLLAGGTYICDRNPLTIIRDRESGQISQSDPRLRWNWYLEVRFNYLEKLRETNKKEFERLGPAFRDFLMVTIITLSKYNRDAALMYYKRIEQYGWQSANLFGMNAFKNQIIKLFGFPFFLKLLKLTAHSPQYYKLKTKNEY